MVSLSLQVCRALARRWRVESEGGLVSCCDTSGQSVPPCQNRLCIARFYGVTVAIASARVIIQDDANCHPKTDKSLRALARYTIHCVQRSICRARHLSTSHRHANRTAIWKLWPIPGIYRFQESIVIVTSQHEKCHRDTKVAFMSQSPKMRLFKFEHSGS